MKRCQDCGTYAPTTCNTCRKYSEGIFGISPINTNKRIYPIISKNNIDWDRIFKDAEKFFIKPNERIDGLFTFEDYEKD